MQTDFKIFSIFFVLESSLMAITIRNDGKTHIFNQMSQNVLKLAQYTAQTGCLQISPHPVRVLRTVWSALFSVPDIVMVEPQLFG